MMLTAIGLFVAGSAAAAMAPNMALLIAARALQGIGGGGITPLVQTTVADMVTPRERGHYQAYMGVAWVMAGVLGPALGGVIADQLHWSVIFWLNVPFGLLAALLALEAAAAPRRPHKQTCRRLVDRGGDRAAAGAHLRRQRLRIVPTIFGLSGRPAHLAAVAALKPRAVPAARARQSVMRQGARDSCASA